MAPPFAPSASTGSRASSSRLYLPQPGPSSLFVGTSSSTASLAKLASARNTESTSVAARGHSQLTPTLMQGLLSGNDDDDGDDDGVSVVHIAKPLISSLPPKPNSARITSQGFGDVTSRRSASQLLMPDERVPEKRQLRDPSPDSLVTQGKRSANAIITSESRTRGARKDERRKTQASALIPQKLASSSRIKVEDVDRGGPSQGSDEAEESQNFEEVNNIIVATPWSAPAAKVSIRPAADGSLRQYMDGKRKAPEVIRIKSEPPSENEDVEEVVPPAGAMHSKLLPPRKQLPDVFSLRSSVAPSGVGDDASGGEDGGFLRPSDESGQLGAPSSVMHTMSRYGRNATLERQSHQGREEAFQEQEDALHRERVASERQGFSDRRSSTMPALYTREEPWPDHFVQLERTFKAVNIIYSFCSARKHMVTSFDVIKSGVEAQLRRPLEMVDLAQIKSLCPDLINFAYVDSQLLQVHFEGAKAVEGGAKPLNGLEGDGLTYRQRAEAKRIALDSIYCQTAKDISVAPLLPVDFAGFPAAGAGWQADIEPSEVGGFSAPLVSLAEVEARKEVERTRDKIDRGEGYVLLFEFNDGTTSGPKATSRRPFRGRGPPSRGYKEHRLRPALTFLPSTQSMQKLIKKRNAKFEQAVLELLAACKVKEEDPVMLLVEAALHHVPVDPELDQTQRLQLEVDTPQRKRFKFQHLLQNPDDRDSIEEIIEQLKARSDYKDQIVPGGRRTFPQREAKFGELDFELSQELVHALVQTNGIERFYTHQAEALNALDAGNSVIVSTSTSSGKSLIYQIPTLRALESNQDATAFFIFPTKALAQDQRRSLQDLLHEYSGLDDILVATYDGDTDRDLRKDIRNKASVIFTNPDMLHQAILPSEEVWRRFLRNLRVVVVDELHTYNGVFGAHVSFIMRRLRRICTALGNHKVQFISCSATVANPKEHMQTLFGIEDVHVVIDDGSPTGKKEWVIWNPPYIDPADPAQGRVGAYSEVSRIFIHLVERGVRTIVFTKVRRTCEIVIRQVRNDLLLEDRHDIVDKVMAYRSGYSPHDRRKIEQDMFKGQLLGIVATSALELGIDIGSLDAVIMLGFPYSISSLRQQAGRAGRRQKDSLSVLIGEPWPTDQHYMRNPENVFTEPDAALSVDLGNDFIMESHLQCAASEMPIDPVQDEQYFGPSLQTLCSTRLEYDGQGFYHSREDVGTNPSKDVAIRGARQVTYTYIDDTPGRAGGPRVMEEVEIDRAIFEAFEGAVFMHQGLSFICREVSHEKFIARMYQADVNYHTRVRDHTDIDAVETHRIRTLTDTPVLAYFGKVTISSRIWGYFKVDRRANILDSVDVDCPPYIRHTKGMWIDVPAWLVNALSEKTINAAAAIHAAEHALLSLTPMFVITAAGDVQTECKIAEREYGKKPTARRRPARLIFYDMPGQNGGVCSKAFAHLDGLLRIATAVIEACSCLDGCLSCVISPVCEHANTVTSKVGALAVLRGLAGREPFDPDLPQQNEPGHASGSLGPSASLQHTVREASPVRAARDTGEVPIETLDEVLPPSLQASQQATANRAPPGTARAPPGVSRTFEEGEDARTPGPEEKTHNAYAVQFNV